MNGLSYGLVGCLLTLGVVHAENSRPNILLITSEDNGPELGCYGDPFAKTPHLDALARQGVRFDRAFVTQAGCSQSRASILTGLYPHQHGQIGLATWKFRMYRDDTPNMVRSLKDLGYRTGIIGKLHVNPASAFPFDTKVLPSSNFARKKLAGYAEQASRFFHASDQPFFLMINYPDAHRPFLSRVNGLPVQPLTGNEVKPLSYFGVDHPELREQTAGYYNCLSRLDTLIGDLLAGLRASGKAGNTLIIYLGDHGADMLRGKRTSYEGGIRVPMILSWPGKLTAGQVRRELVSTIDLFPTILEAVQSQARSELPGHSLLGLLRGEQSRWRSHLFTEYHLHSAHNFYPQRTVRDDRYKLIQSLMPGEINPGYAFTMKRFFPELSDSISRSAETVRAAYERMHRPPEFELYDLKRDPHEFQDLSEDEDHQVVLQKLQRKLARWRRETADPLLDPHKLSRLKGEIDASFVDGVPQKGQLELNYPDYFFGSRSPAESASNERGGRPNVLFIAVDDLKDWVNCLGGYEGTVHTPNIDRLASRGMLFTNAHCPSPKCAPSRAAIMTGLRPSTTGLYDNSHWWLPNLPDVVTIPSHFRKHGYRVTGAGKIFHHTAGNHPPNQWDDFLRLTFRNDPWFRGAKLNYPWSTSAPTPKGFPFSTVPGLGHENDWGSLGIPETDHDDSKSVDYAVDALKRHSSGPFFLACGIFRPHLPWYVPQQYFDRYKLEDVVLPKIKENDLEDVPPAGREFAKARRSDLNTILKADKYRHAVRAYLASITFADTQIGRVLDALDASPFAENTVIVLWSDHGWHLGEKNHWHKTTLWEEATRVPLIISVPGYPPGRCAAPVNLIDLYPTLIELCGLASIAKHDGASLVPLLKDPATPWKRASITQFKRGNAAVRSRRYRYIRYRDGGEELYDHHKDPYEWDNLAYDSRYEKVKAELAAALPGTWAKSAQKKGAYAFDPTAYTWTHKESGSITYGR